MADKYWIGSSGGLASSDSTNSRFYLHSDEGGGTDYISYVSITKSGTKKRITYYIVHSTHSSNIFQKTFTPFTTNYFGVGAYRDSMFSDVFIFPTESRECVVGIGDEETRSDYSTINESSTRVLAADRNL